MAAPVSAIGSVKIHVMNVILVNGEAIGEAAVRRETTALLELMAAKMEGDDLLNVQPRAREWAEENLIETLLMRQTALRDPSTMPASLPDSPEEAAQLRMENLIARITAHASPPRHKDVVEYYRKHREDFREPERIRAAHIVRNVDENHAESAARAAIERARDELAKGRPFAEVADELSDCPGKGGALDRFTRGEMVPEFEDVVFALGVGEVSGIFRTEFGFHIATVLERLPAGISPLEAVMERIETVLLEEKKAKRLHQYVDNLRAKAVIQKGVVSAS